MQFTILTLIAYFPKDAEVTNIATWIVILNRSSATVTVGKLWRYSLILLLLEAADIFFIYALFYLFFLPILPSSMLIYDDDDNVYIYYELLNALLQ